MKFKSPLFLGISILYFLASTTLWAADENNIKQLERLLSLKAEKPQKLDLSGVDMRSYDLCSHGKHKKIRFNNANLSGTNFSGIKICDIDFEGANLEHANLENTLITDCDFSHTRASDVLFTNAAISSSSFNHATLERAKFNRTTLESVGFDHANLRKANFNGATLYQVNFYYADLTGSLRKEINVDRTNFEKSKGTGWFN